MPGDPASMYQAGDRVRIVDLGKPGHVRTPFYAREKAGIIERYCGRFENPEDRAYGRGKGHTIALYRVRLCQRDLWPNYAGSERDTLEIEIYEHWLKRDQGAAQ